MIRIFVLMGVVGVLLATYLAVFVAGPETQLPPSESLLTGFRAEGYVPASPNLAIDETPEEVGVFQVPPEDEVQLDLALAKLGDMSGMDMSGGTTMDMGTDTTTMDMGTDTTAMDMGTDTTTMDMGTDTTAMDMGADTATMDMGTDTTTMAMGTDTTAMDMGTDTTTMSPSNAAMGMAEGGLRISKDGAFDREINLTMEEWKFSDMQIDVKMGERIKFTVNNGGQIPHEFMFMTMPAMAAVTYRQKRADWNLVEHKALFEQSLVLPGGEFSFVLEVAESGSWMFMCMLPYHMQLGMMGQMSTEGMAMTM